MKIPSVSQGQAQVLIGLGGLAVAIIALYYTKKGAEKVAEKVAEGVSKAAQAVNPSNDKNIVNQGINKLFGFDNESQSIGTWLYDKFNSEQKTEPTAKPAPVKPVATTANPIGTGVLLSLKNK